MHNNKNGFSVTTNGIHKTNAVHKTTQETKTPGKANLNLRTRLPRQRRGIVAFLLAHKKRPFHWDVYRLLLAQQVQRLHMRNNGVACDSAQNYKTHGIYNYVLSNVTLSHNAHRWPHYSAIQLPQRLFAANRESDIHDVADVWVLTKAPPSLSIDSLCS